MKRALLVIALCFSLCVPAFAGTISNTGMSQGDLVSWMTKVQSRVNTGRNFNFTSGALAVAADVALFKTAATIAYTINGVLYTKVATDNIPWAPTPTNMDNNTVCAFVISVNAAGTVAVTQGTVKTGTTAPVIPAPPADSAVIGMIHIVNTSGSTYTPGSTSLNTSNVTETFVNVAGGIVSNETADVSLTQ